jgi:hypothetical protein
MATRKPCPGCSARNPNRAPDAVCDDCKRIIANAKATSDVVGVIVPPWNFPHWLAPIPHCPSDQASAVQRQLLDIAYFLDCGYQGTAQIWWYAPKKCHDNLPKFPLPPS